jgi:hypothetical protein
MIVNNIKKYIKKKQRQKKIKKFKDTLLIAGGALAVLAVLVIWRILKNRAKKKIREKIIKSINERKEERREERKENRK